MNKPPFNDRRVRQAFALATDREALAQVLFNGYYLPATGGFIPLGMPGHSAEIRLRYDPTQARQFLTEAGYVSGRGFPVTVSSTIRDTQVLIESFTRELQAVGVKCISPYHWMPHACGLFAPQFNCGANVARASLCGVTYGGAHLHAG